MTTPRPRRAAGILLWIAQTLLALLFTFAGVAKLTMAPDVLVQAAGLPLGFLRFIAVAEIAGALGLVLPGLLRVARGLTPLAAAGLVTIMSGAVTLTALRQGVAPAVFPFLVGVALVLVIRGRRAWLAAPPRAARPAVRHEAVLVS